MISKIGIHQQGIELDESLTRFYEEQTSPAKEEIDLFASAMKKDPADMNISEQFLNKVNQLSDDLKAKSDSINKSFKTTKSSDDYTSMIQSLREISDYGFQTAVLTKVVSKTTQAVEKLTNLN
jgi:type III secretion system YscI/HrpB-like protein